MKAEPYSHSCKPALERLNKAQALLTPFKRTMELARARERRAYGELTVCHGGGLYSVERSQRCSNAQWQAPERTKEVIAAEVEYLREKEFFAEHFKHAWAVCWHEP